MLGYYRIWVESEGVFIRHTESTEAATIIPLSDFKTIAQAWADFQRQE